MTTKAKNNGKMQHFYRRKEEVLFFEFIYLFMEECTVHVSQNVFS